MLGAIGKEFEARSWRLGGAERTGSGHGGTVRVKCAFVAWFVECLRGFTYLLFQFSQNTINESSLLSPVPYSVSGCAERRDIETDDASCS